MIKTTHPLNLALLFILSILLSACGGSSSSSDSGEQVKTFTVKASASPSIGGSVSGAGKYQENSTFSLQAEPNDGFAFVRWQENGATVSNEPTLSAKATKDRVFTAFFSGIEEIKVSPVGAQIPLNSDLALSAQAVYLDGFSKDVTDSVTWTSSDSAIATFDANSDGVLISKEQGTVQVSATIGAVSGAVSVTVTSPVLDSLTLSIDELELAQGETGLVQVEGHYDDGVVIDVTDSVTWTSSNDSIASVVGQGEAGGLITGLSMGSANIVATLGGVTAAVDVTVNQTTLDSLSVSANSTDIDEGALSKLTATATYSDSSSSDVTEQGLWRSSNPLVATVSNSPSTKGHVSALSSGSAKISVKVGALTKEIDLTVDSAPNAPGALTLQAAPNVILNNGFDTSTIVATVLPNDTEHETVVNVSSVKFTPSDTGLVLDSNQGNTVSGKVETGAVSSTSGQYDLTAEVPGTIAIDQVTLRVVSDFSDAIGSIRIQTTPAINGYLQPGSLFVGTIINLSNRPFKIDGLTLSNGPDEIASLVSNGKILTMGETSKVSLKLRKKVQDRGVKIVFELSDTSTTTSFTKEINF